MSKDSNDSVGRPSNLSTLFATAGAFAAAGVPVRPELRERLRGEGSREGSAESA